MAKVKLKISSRLLKKRAKRTSFSGKKVCKFCSNKQVDQFLDYKNAGLLKNFLTERGKILPARISGLCASHQRELANQIKTARVMSLLPYSSIQA